MAIALLESLSISEAALSAYQTALERKGHTFVAYPRTEDVETLKERVADADILMLANMPLKGEIIRAASKLRFVNVAFTGVDHVDLDACKERGVKVSNASGYATQSVAEVVLGMTLSLLRNIPQVDTRARGGQTKDGLVGEELSGKTVGIVGYGAIGRRVAALLRAFGCSLLIHDPSATPEEGVEMVPLETLFEASDIITLHCPLNSTTQGLVRESLISRMKKGSLLINTARGAVVDSQALAKALHAGAIGGVGIDVFEKEPPLPLDHPLLHTPNTIVTPHIAFATKQSMELRAKIVFESLDSFLEGRQINHIL